MANEVPGLVPGKVHAEHLSLLIFFARIRSEPVVAALNGYFIQGKPQKDLIDLHSVSQSQLSQKVAEIRKISEQVRTAIKYYPSE